MRPRCFYSALRALGWSTSIPTSASQTPARKDSGPPTASWAIDNRRDRQPLIYQNEAVPFLSEYSDKKGYPQPFVIRIFLPFILRYARFPEKNMRIKIYDVILFLKEVTIMEKFKIIANIVLDFMIENHYSEHSLSQYKRIYETMGEYLTENNLSYSPELGWELLDSGSDAPFGSKGKILHEAVIRKINAVYATGSVSNVLVSPRKPYSALRLKASFSEVLERFTGNIQTLFSETQIENIHRRCSLFLKYLQARGKEKVSSITYQDISEYHFSELSHLKQVSRLIEEGAICHFLRFLFQEKQISCSLCTYMYALETDSFIGLSSLSDIGRQPIQAHHQIQIPSARYQQMIDDLIRESQKAGYVPAYRRGLERALRYFELFLDFYKLDYSLESSDAWLEAQRTKEVFQGSSWTAARRALFLLKVYATTEKIDFSAVLPHGVSGLSMLPEWMLAPLMNYSELRAMEKLDDDTVNNDVYSILRFFRFLISEKISSFQAVSAETLIAFNLSDKHLSSEGKNACMHESEIFKISLS